LRHISRQIARLQLQQTSRQLSRLQLRQKIGTLKLYATRLLVRLNFKQHLRQLSGNSCVKWTFELRGKVAVNCVAKQTKNLPENLASKDPTNGSSKGPVIGAAMSWQTMCLL
jgi:hypothetical protein